MSGERVLQATAIIDIEDRASGKIGKLAQKLASLERLTKMMGKAEGFGAFDRQAQGIEKAATAIGHLERQVTNLTRINNVAGDIDKIARSVERLDRASARGAASNRRLHDSLSFADRAGQMGMVAGPAILAGTRRAWHAGAEVQHSEIQMRNAGMSAPEIARARDLAGSIAKDVPTLTVAELMELHKETRSAVQHAEEAFHLMPQLARAKAALKGMGIENASLSDVVKGGESLGLMSDPARFERYLEGQVKAMAVMGKTISTEQVYEAAKYSKSAGATLSDEFLNLVMPSLIQEMHGSSAGDALAMLVKTFRGGMNNKHIPVERMEALGLLEDPSLIRRSKTGSIKGYSGKIVGDDLLSSDPGKWFTQIFKPAAEKAGYNTLSDQVRLLNQVLPQTAANLGRILIQQEETLKAHRALYEGAPSVEEMVQNQRSDATASLSELGHSIDNFLGVLASPIMGDAARMMDSVARSIGGWQEQLAAFQKENPEAAKWLGGGALAVAGTAGAAGTYGLVSGLINGFGLKGSAVALDGSAAALTAAAGRLGVGGIAGAVAGAGAAAGGGAAASAGGVIGSWLTALGVSAGVLTAVDGAAFYGLAHAGGSTWRGHPSSGPGARHEAGWIDWFTGDPEPSLGSRRHGAWRRRHPEQYSTGGGFGGESAEVMRAQELERLANRSGGFAGGSGSVRDFSLGALIHPDASFPMPQARPDRPYDGALPMPRPSDAEMAGFGDTLKSGAAEFVSTLNGAFTGNATVSFEVKPGPMFEGYVRTITKSEMRGFTLTGPGSNGTNGANVDQHN